MIGGGKTIPAFYDHSTDYLKHICSKLGNFSVNPIE